MEQLHQSIDAKEQIAPGWEGKPKGHMQVLGERGLIDRALLEKYTHEGRKDAITGKVDVRYSLRHLMTECSDFKEENTALQYLGTQLGVPLLATICIEGLMCNSDLSSAHATWFDRNYFLIGEISCMSK